jgi:sec-independent protein translocase protein TatC
MHEARSFTEHINELRSRLFWVAAVFVVSSSVAYQFHDLLVKIIIAPLGHQKLVYLTPGGGFNFIFQITMVAGGLVALPSLIYHLYRFVVPALPQKTRQHTLSVSLASVVLMIAGASFGYFIAVPAALNFLTTFAGDYITANLTADSYLGFVLSYIIGLGALFQLPLVLIFWNWVTPIGPRKLLNTERFLVLFAFIVAAIITPTPDVVNQIIIAMPIIVVYQIGVIAVFIMSRKKRSYRSPTSSDAHVTMPQKLASVPVSADLDEVLRVIASKPVVKPKKAGDDLLQQAQVIGTDVVRAVSSSSRATTSATSNRPRSVDGF